MSAPASIRSRLETLALEDGGRTAFIEAGTSQVVTWGEIAELMTDWSTTVPAGSVIGLCLKSPAEFCRAYLAALACGVCVAPLDPNATPDELALLLEILELADVVVDEETEAAITDDATGLWSLASAGIRQTRRTKREASPSPGAAVLLPTSGTTGRPKVVPLGEQQLLRVAGRISANNELTSLDRGYCPLPLFHVNAQVVGILSTLVSGASLIVENRFHRSDFWAKAEAFEATWLNLVPAILGTLCQGAPGDVDTERVRFARSASSSLPVTVQERFEATFGVGVLETYGMTEAASQITANPYEPSRRRRGSVGLPIGVTLRVVDDDGRQVAVGEIGSVEIGGPDVVEVYLGPDRVPRAARTEEGWLITGDLGLCDQDGYLYLSGRSDEVINRGGEKCYPREVEEVLRRNRGVSDAAVVGRPHPLLGAEPVAYVVAAGTLDEDGRAALSDELLTSCRQVLSRYKCPVKVTVVDTLPKGHTGKTARSVLEDEAAQQLSSENPST